MATSRKKSRRPTAAAARGAAEAAAPDMLGTTGRYLVLLPPDGAGTLANVAGLRVARSSDFKAGAASLAEAGDADALVLDEIGVAVVDAPPDQLRALRSAAEAGTDAMVVEPERYVRAFEAPSADYFRGYRDAVNALVEKGLGGAPAPDDLALVEATTAWDEANATWGLQATQVIGSSFTGKGIRVAVLDTGIDSDHPDFAGRKIVAQSFVRGEAPQDGHGHGTHCIGTACGPSRPKQLPRYGVAGAAEIYAGKVLSNQGSGADSGILAGINWAISNRCAVISMSLGATVGPGARPSVIFEAVAVRALLAGSLIIAAAGNDSSRPFSAKPVSHPANCPSILAVAALDPDLGVAPFSNGGINPLGGEVNIAGPGVNVLSSVPRPRLYARFNGTSMATPHVAGIAALYAQASPSNRGRALWNALRARTRALPLPARDVGAGLVIAP